MNLDEQLIARIRALAKPLDPIFSGVAPRLARMEGARAILFDLYGTLLISASGDIGAASSDAGQAALRAAVRAEHERLRAMGVAHPEVDIRAIWRSIRPDLADETALTLYALDCEWMGNPVWPMPGAVETLAELERRGFAVGIVSNAQFYSPLIFRALLGRDPPLPAVWSYELGEAKPSPRLFRIALDELSRRGIKPEQVLYVGNDMVKDIEPALALRCRTALFAGDARSYRPTPSRQPPASPDAVITELAQIVTGLLGDRKKEPSDGTGPEEVGGHGETGPADGNFQ